MIDQSNEDMSIRVKHLKDAGLLKTHEPKSSTQSIETISITAEDGTVYEFEKPDFQCELLKVYKDTIIIGSACDAYHHSTLQAISWMTDGCTVKDRDSIYELTPIKKPWYEDESNFPTLLKAQGEYYLETYPLNEGTKVLVKTNKIRLATKEELLALYVEE